MPSQITEMQTGSACDGPCHCQLKAELPTRLADSFLSQKFEEETRETVLSQKGLEKQKEHGSLGKLCLCRLEGRQSAKGQHHGFPKKSRDGGCRAVCRLKTAS